MSAHQPARPPSRRTPLGEATRRVNNSQQPRPRSTSKSSQIPHHESLKQDGLLQVIDSSLTSTPSYSDYYPAKEIQRIGSPGPNINNPRLSAISKESNRNSQISTVSTNASDGKRIKARIGPWKLGKTLGKGATARVRLARHAFTGQQAAIKIVQKKNAQMSQAGSLADLDVADADMLDLDDGVRRMPVGIEREVAIMKLIQHPNIMKLYDIWENRTEIYLVLEYVDNGELFEHITVQGRLQEEEAIKYFRQMLSAVGYCHSFNICHRDLKPENILLTKDLTIKIADFGMAALHQGPDHKLKTSCGSPHYAAPELIKGSLYRGDKVDIWSMGVILYATLAGRLPFDVDGNDRDFLSLLLAKIKLGDFEMQPEFSKEAQNLIWRILQVDPRNRINMKQIWAHPLIRKYDYLDDYGAGTFPMSPSIKTCGHPVLRRSDINKDLLRQLRSMWHRLSENDLIEALLNDKPNEQKLFYSLLLKYRDAQLENFIPDIGYSNSDYHHLRPLALTKTYSTRNFTQSRANGHGRQISRFTVISNVAETEQSYDPFKASRPQHLDNFRMGAHPKVTIHRTRPSDDDGYAKATPKYCQDSLTSFSYSGSSDRSRQRKLASHRAYASRSSLASSTQSRGSGSHRRASSGYKRGVSFSHLRRQPMAARGLSKYHSNYTEVTDNDGDTLRPVAEMSASTQYIRSRKSQAYRPNSLLTEPKPARSSQLWTDDVRQLSSSLAKDCDEAFNRLETVEENPRRHSAPLSPPPKNKGNSLLDVPKRLKRASLDDRPLPLAPAQTDEMKLELIEAKKQAELRKVLGGPDSPSYLNRMVSHIDRLIQPTSPVGAASGHRSLSAPVDSKPKRPNELLTSIFEAKKEEESPSREAHPSKLDNGPVRGGAKSSRIASAPEPRDSKKNQTQDRFASVNSDARATIRVVQSDSPVKAPAPLTIRKKNSQGGPHAVLTRNSALEKARYENRKCHTGIELRQQSQAGLSTDNGPNHAANKTLITDDYANDSNSGTIMRKKPTWFKRNSKSGNEPDWRMSTGGGIAGHSQSSSTDTSGRTNSDAPLPIPPKKKFSLGRLFKKRSSKVDMMALGNDSFDERLDNESIAESLDEDRRVSDGRRVSNHDETKTRQIEPQRNWLAKLFNVKPASKLICFTVSKSRARVEIVRVLKEWRRYGIRDVQTDKARSLVFARVAKKNFLDMKEVAFAAEFMTVIHHGNRGHLCIGRFTQERGAASSFHKVVETLETVLRARGMLVNDERKSRMMVKTLRSAK